jgi:ubiquinone/menaquinone biosynthesis C-methylase UbiE
MLKRCAVFLAVVSLTLCAQTPSPTKSESRDEQREKSLKLAEIIQALGISEGSKVADIGAGSGFVTARLARKVGPSGQVYAVDIDPGAIKQLKELVEKQSLSNVVVVHNEPDDPKLPAASLDAVLMLNAYHEVEPYQEMLKHVLASLKPGGRMVVVDPMAYKTRARPRADQMKNHVFAPELAESEFRAAGFELVLRQDNFVDRPDEEGGRWMIVCRRPM